MQIKYIINNKKQNIVTYRMIHAFTDLFCLNYVFGHYKMKHGISFNRETTATTPPEPS